MFDIEHIQFWLAKRVFIRGDTFSKLEDLDVSNENYKRFEVHDFIWNIDPG